MSTVSSQELRELLDAAVTVAHAGGRRTLAHFANSVAVENKSDGSPVTIADRDAEEFMTAWIHRRFPEHAVLGEEFGASGASAESSRVRWILDPIDGTRSFVRGAPLYGSLVGIEVDGEASVGVIYLPGLDELVSAGRGLGCTLNGRPCSVSGVDKLDESLIVSTDFDRLRRTIGAERDEALASEVDIRRTWGDCYGYAMVATGRAEASLDCGLALWDCAALLPIIEEAGGRFTTFEGERTIHKPNIIASNGVLHEELLARVG